MSCEDQEEIARLREELLEARLAVRAGADKSPAEASRLGSELEAARVELEQQKALTKEQREKANRLSSELPAAIQQFPMKFSQESVQTEAETEEASKQSGVSEAPATNKQADKAPVEFISLVEALRCEVDRRKGHPGLDTSETMVMCPSLTSVSCFPPFVQSHNLILRFARYKSSQVRAFRSMVFFVRK